MKITAEPRSDQWNASDFIVGSKTFTIADVKNGSAEQKYDIILDEGQGRSWRPPLTVLRIIMAAWGDESDDWIGRRVTLYRDEKVRFGSDTPGGIRLSHMSNLPGNKTFTIKLPSSRGKNDVHRVEPLPDAPPPITAEHVTAFEQRIQAATTTADLDSIARDLKARDLGQHRSHLLGAWSERRTALDTVTEQPVLGEGEQQ